MKKLVIIVCITSMFFGCKQNLSERYSSKIGDIEISKDSVSKKYYTKDVSKDFSSFLNNPQNYSSRAAENEESENSVFIEMWNNLTEDEKEMLINNAEDVEVSKDSLISIKSETPVGRAALNGDTTEIDLVSAIYFFNEWLNENFGNMKIDLSLLNEEFKDYEDFVPVNLVIDYFLKLDKWNDIESILTIVNSKISIDEIRAEYNKLKTAMGLSQTDVSNCRVAKTLDYQDKPIRENVGKTLKDGTVILTCFKKRAYPVIGGQWAHAGIFSKELFDAAGGDDSSHCVYTAQPNGYDDFPEDLKPDRTNCCCLDTICLYSYQKKMATLLPKNYTKAKATIAVKYAKETFYDDENETEYHIPINEFFYLGNSSHDMTVKNPYCSKVVYSAWKEAGVNLDGKTFGGNLVTPDDLYGSAIDKYITITIRIKAIFFSWSKTYKIKTYSATSDIKTNERQ